MQFFSPPLWKHTDMMGREATGALMSSALIGCPNRRGEESYRLQTFRSVTVSVCDRQINMWEEAVQL